MFETQIREALKKAGLPEDDFSKISVNRESEIPDAVKTYKRKIDTEKLETLAKEAGLSDVFKTTVQSETDKRVTQALETAKKKHEEEIKKLKAEKTKKSDLDEKSDLDKKSSDVNPEIVALKNQIAETNKTLLEFVRRDSIATACKDAKVPESFQKFVTGNTIEEINASVSSVMETVIEQRKFGVTEHIEKHGQPIDSLNSDIAPASIKELAETRNKKSIEDKNFPAIPEPEFTT